MHTLRSDKAVIFIHPKGGSNLICISTSVKASAAVVGWLNGGETPSEDLLKHITWDVR